MNSSRNKVGGKSHPGLLLALILTITVIVVVILIPKGGKEEVTVADAVEELEEQLPVPHELIQADGSPEDNQVAEQPEADTSVEIVDDIPPAESDENDLIRVHGRVINANTAQPIPGARISFLDHDMITASSGIEEPGVLVETVADEGGHWEMEVPRVKVNRVPGMGNVYSVFTLKASAPDYATVVQPDYQDGAFSGDSKEIDLLLDEAGSIAGRVVDESGNAIEGARVGWRSLLSNSGRQSSRLASSQTVTDADGNFELSSLPVGGRVSFPVIADGFIPKTSEAYPVGERDALITLERGTGVIHGRFLHVDGSPVTNGHVHAVRTSAMSHGAPFIMAVALVETRTDNEGTFRFENLKAGQYRLIASTGEIPIVAAYGSYALGTIQKMVELNEGGEKEEILQFSEDLTISGRVIDKESRQGVRGVVVSPTHLHPGMARPEGAVVTGHDGQFSVVIHQPTSFANLFLSMPEGWVHVPNPPYDGYNRVGIQLSDRQDPDPVTIEAAPGLLVRGKVVESDGQTPVPGVRPLKSVRGGSPPSLDPTDGLGEFRLYATPNDSFGIRVHAPNGYADATVSLGREAPEPVVLQLEEYAEISGYVRDASDQPLEGFGMVAMHATLEYGGNVHIRTSIGPVVHTNESGYYFIDKLPPREVSVNVRQDSLDGKYSPPPTRTLELEPGEYRRDVDFVLHDSEPLEGKVVDGEGNPLPNVRISAYNMESSEGHYHSQVTTNDEGVFALTGVPEHANLHLSAIHDGYIHQQEGAKKPEDFPLVIRMQPAGGFRLRVVDDRTGEPVERFLYKVISPTINRFLPGTALEARNPQGETNVTNYMPGRAIVIHVVDVVSHGRVGTRRGMAEGSVSEDGEEVIEVRLREAASIRGTVYQYDESGNRIPAAGVEVLAMPDDGRNFHFHYRGHYHGQWRQLAFAPPRMTTELDGTFSLNGLDEGDYILEARRESPAAHGSTKASIVDNIDTTGVEINISTGVMVNIVLLDHHGDPLPDVPIEHRDTSQLAQGSPLTVVTTDVEGRATLEGLIPGSHSVTPRHELYNATHNFQIVHDMEELDVLLDYTGLIKLSGVMTLNGRAFPQMERLMIMDGEVNARVKAFRRNREQYSLWIGPGDYRLATFRSPAGQVRLATFTVNPAPIEQEKDFHIEEATGHVVVVFPSNDDFEPGVVTISRGDGSEGYHGIAASVTMSSEDASISSLPVERLRATFRANSGKWHGVSDWVDVTRHGENMFIIDLDDHETIRIGQWSQEVLSTDYSDLVMNVTSHLDRPGTWEVLFDYQSGNEGLMIESVALLANGAVIDIDIHPGWSGFTRHDHIYTLNVPDIEPGVVYQVVASIHAGSDQDSRGDVWLRR
ncbi:MAG: carboxypeptidase regulatory-like domain-containing protein [Candidatus Sumerlaeia bacterium]|nr:carboxypeptidase regulatory-like domain-containing protein [Candidatus Sumerlaeia bacterium]